MKHFLTFLLTFVLPACVLAQKPIKVEGEYQYVGTENQTIAECKRLALEGARLNALAREFGTQISQDIMQQEVVGSNGENHLFDSRSQTSVRGEWIADEGEPEYKVEMSSDGSPIVTCKVRGRAKALSNEGVEFLARTLRNGSADDSFRSGDRLSLEFRTPVDGYIAVFLSDDQGNVYTLLPYLANTSGQVKLKRGVDYVFFDPAKAHKESDEVDEMILMTDREIERNVLHVVFSPNAFTRPNDSANGTEAPRSLSIQDFNRWLTACKGNDKRFTSRNYNLIIKQ